MSGLRIKINYCFIVFFLLITLISLRTMAKDHCQSCNGSAENNLGIMYRDNIDQDLFRKFCMTGISSARFLTDRYILNLFFLV